MVCRESGSGYPQTERQLILANPKVGRTLVSEDKCPICGKPQSEFDSLQEPLPFCSERCKNADLGKWLDGNYSVGRPLTEGEVWSLREDADDD